jgi:hypothetical protein
MIPIRMHVACGDTLVTAGLIVELHKIHGPIAVPTYPKYEVFVRSLFHNFPDISVYTVSEPYPWGAPSNEVYDAAMERAGLDKSKEIRLGNYYQGVQIKGTEGTYLQAEVPYQKRWESCPIKEAVKHVPQLDWNTPSRVFYHDDPARGYMITRLVDKETAYFPRWNNNILQYVHILQTAEQIHVIDSAFWCLVNQLDLDVSTKLFFHRYARVGSTVPIERHNWMELL